MLITWVLVIGIKESAWVNDGDDDPEASAIILFFVVVGSST